MSSGEASETAEEFSGTGYTTRSLAEVQEDQANNPFAVGSTPSQRAAAVGQALMPFGTGFIAAAVRENARARVRTNRQDINSKVDSFSDKKFSQPPPGPDAYGGDGGDSQQQQGKLAATPKAIVIKKPIASVVSTKSTSPPASVSNAKLGTATPNRKITTRAPLSFSTGAFKTALGS